MGFSVRAVVVGLFIALMIGFQARAGCPPPTLTVGTPDAGGVASVTAHANGDCQSIVGSTISLAWNGNTFYSKDCTFPFYNSFSEKCQIDTQVFLACLPDGPNILSASSSCSTGPVEQHCPMSDSSATGPTFQGHHVDGTISYSGPDVFGHGTVTVTYDVGQYRSGARAWVYDNGAQVRYDTPAGQAGSYSFAYGFTCSTVMQHQLTAHIAPWCDDPSLAHDDSKSVTLSGETTISAEYHEGDNSVTISDTFPNTDDATERAVYYNVNGAGWTRLGNQECYQDLTNNCNVTFPEDLS